MKILGIGNAIVDVLCKISDEFLEKNSLTKGTMKLIDEKEFKRLISLLKIEETVSGGSVANSIVGLAQLGNEVGFLGKVSDDYLGQKYEEGLKKENVEYLYNKKKPLTVVKPGNQTRRFTHIEDTMKVCFEAWKKDQNKHYSIFYNKNYSILAVAKMFKSKIKFLPFRK